MKVVRDARGRNDFFIADSNFGMYKEDIQTAYWIAEAQKKCGWPEYIVCSTGKNQHARVMEVSKIVNDCKWKNKSVWFGTKYRSRNTCKRQA